MQKNRTMEVVAILSLSLVLTSTLSISGIVPSLLDNFSNHSRASVEFLISVPSISVTVMVVLSPLVSKFLSERQTIILGLLIAGVFGIFPFFISSYLGVLLARFIMGLGIGLINTRAISIIGERFVGATRAKLLGFRLSAETIGQTIMALVAGQLLGFGWRAPFLIYSLSFVILFIYLVFIPSEQDFQSQSNFKIKKSSTLIKMTKRQLRFVLMNAIFAGFLIVTNVSNALRIPSYVVVNGLGTAFDANRILSLSMFAGFLAGVFFGKLVSSINKKFLPLFLFTSSVGLILIPLSSTIYLIALAAFVTGFSITNCISYVFMILSEKLPTETLNSANAIIIVGCNLGATLTPIILTLIGKIHSSLSTSFVVYAITFLCLSVGTFIIPKLMDNRLRDE